MYNTTVQPHVPALEPTADFRSCVSMSPLQLGQEKMLLSLYINTETEWLGRVAAIV